MPYMTDPSDNTSMVYMMTFQEQPLLILVEMSLYVVDIITAYDFLLPVDFRESSAYFFEYFASWNFFITP